MKCKLLAPVLALSFSVFLCIPASATGNDLGYGEIQIGEETSSDDSQDFDPGSNTGSGDLNSDMGDGSIIIEDGINPDQQTDSGSVIISDDTADPYTDPSGVSDTDDGIIIENVSDEQLETRSLIRYRTAGISDTQKSLQKIWDVINGYADLDYYRRNGWSDLMQAGDRQKLAEISNSVTNGCKTDLDKIQAVYDYVTENVYYDWDYADDPDSYPDRTHTALEVYQTKRAVCEGYASLSKVLLQLSGVPCISVRGLGHIYSAGYDSDNKKWVIFDTTWGSGNYLDNGQFYDQPTDYNYFDIGLEFLAKLKQHEVLWVDGLLPKNTNNAGHYGFRSNKKDWSNMSEWYCTLEDSNNKRSVTAVDSIGDIPVLKVEDFGFDDDELISLDLSQSKIQTIGSGAFRNCKRLTDFVAPKTLTEIKDYAFFRADELTGLDLSNTQVRFIGEYAFSDCKSLARVLFPETLESLGMRCFRGCTDLRIASVFQTQVREIPVGCFRGCTTLRAFTGSDKLDHISENAFTSCPHLHYMLLYNKNVVIDDHALGGYVHTWYGGI